MQYEFLALIPPLVVVVLAGITKNVRISVGVAILTAGLIATDFSIPAALHVIATRFWEVSELASLSSWSAFQNGINLPVCLFLLFLGIIIELIQYSGGVYAYGSFIMDKIKSAKNAQRASLLLSMAFVMDDYFSSLMVGAVMRPVTDQFRVARVKLAMLVNALASPLVVLFPLSSWVGMIVGSLPQQGAQGTTLTSPYALYFASIPFLFYSLIAFAAVWFMVNTGFSFGLLAKHETIAEKTGNLFAGKVSVTRQPRKGVNNRSVASVWDFLLPIFLLIGSVILIKSYGSRIFISLFEGSLLTVVLTIGYLLIRGCIAVRDVPMIIKQGFMLMLSCVMVVLLIWTLSELLKQDLHTGQYLAKLLGSHVSTALLPALFFLVSALISATMGSAWGTIGTLMPIVVPMVESLSGGAAVAVPSAMAVLLPIIGAVISGAVSGNHMAPIADVMFMSATSAGCYHLDLVKVMVSFALPIIGATACAFACAGFLIMAGFGTLSTVLISLAVGCMLNFMVVSLLHWLSHRGVK